MVLSNDDKKVLYSVLNDLYKCHNIVNDLIVRLGLEVFEHDDIIIIENMVKENGEKRAVMELAQFYSKRATSLFPFINALHQIRLGEIAAKLPGGVVLQQMVNWRANQTGPVQAASGFATLFFVRMFKKASTTEDEQNWQEAMRLVWELCVCEEMELVHAIKNGLDHYSLVDQSALLAKNPIFNELFDSTAFETLLPTFHRVFKLSLQISSQNKQHIINNAIALFIACTGRSGEGDHIAPPKSLHGIDLLLSLVDQCNNNNTHTAMAWYIRALISNFEYKTSEIVSIAKTQSLAMKRVGNEGIHLQAIDIHIILQSLDERIKNLPAAKQEQNIKLCLVEAGALGSFCKASVNGKWKKIGILKLELTEGSTFNLPESSLAPSDRCTVRNLTIFNRFTNSIVLQPLFEHLFTFICNLVTIRIYSSVITNKFADLSDVFDDERMRNIEMITFSFITFEDASALHSSLTNYKQLVWFRMDQCIIDSVALLSIMNAIKECNKLTELHLIGMESIKSATFWNQFCVLLPQFKQLKSLWLSNNSLSSSQIDQLIDNLPPLQEIDLRGNDVLLERQKRKLADKKIYNYTE